MVMKDQVLDISPLGMIFTVLQTKKETGGKSLDLEWCLLPQCNMVDTLYHIHPNAIETYHVLEGEMEFYVKDKWIKAKAGDRLRVDAGVKHAFRNPNNYNVKVFNTHQPAFDMEDYFEDVSRVTAMARDKKTNKVNMKRLKTLLLFGRLMANYRREIIAVDPPDFLVRSLGMVAKLAGIDYRDRH